MLPLLPPETHIEFTRQLYGRGHRREWPDDPMYQRELKSQEIRPDPIWMAMRTAVITMRHSLARIGFPRRIARAFSLGSPSRNAPITRSTAGDAQPCDGC